MKVKLQQVTPEAEEQIVEIARVSSSRKDKKAESHKLVNYLIKNNHWSPFEHAIMTVEIETSRGIAAQLLRHRSFTFQEFSQRYQDVTKIGTDVIQEVELRQAGATNRQSSLEVFDPMINIPVPMTTNPSIKGPASKILKDFMGLSLKLYSELLQAGVATECARFVLPLATTTKLYMTGNVRSWIHFLALRDDDHAQKEVRLIAKEIKKLFIANFPNVAKALEYTVEEEGRKQYVRLSPSKKKAVKKDSKKYSYAELATMYGVSESSIRRICKA